MNLWTILFGKKSNGSDGSEGTKEQSNNYVAIDFSYDLNSLIEHTVRTEKLENSQEKYNEALGLVEPEYRYGLEMFLESGVATQEFADYLYTNENAQKAVNVVFGIEEREINRLKDKLERRGISKDTYEAALALIEPKYQQEFKKFISTGEASPEFSKYLDADEKAQKAAYIICEEQGKRLEELGRYLRGEKSLDDKVGETK